MSKQKEFVIKWLPMLEKIQGNDALKERCKSFNVYIPSADGDSLLKELQFHHFLEEAYKSGIVVSKYDEFTNGKEELVSVSNNEFINTLSKKELLSCIAWHFRRDHFSEGSLINESFVDGSLLRLFKSFNRKQ